MIVFSIALRFVKEKSQNPLRATDTIGQEKGRFLKFRVFAARENAKNDNFLAWAETGSPLVALPT